MTGYTFYLTRSPEVASLISEACRKKIGTDNIAAIGNGPVGDDCRIPSTYHNDGWFYAMIEYQKLVRPVYEIVFA